MLPEFPVFKNLELSDREEIEKLTKPFLPYSDFHFTTIYCWDIDNTTQISTLNNNLIIKQIDCLTCEQFFSFLGINSVPETVKEITDYLYKNKLPLILRWIPEDTIKHFNGIKASITEDRDYFDYIYNVSDLYNATGRKYNSYRRDISHFNRYYPSLSSSLIDLSSSKTKKQIIKLFNTWSDNKLTENKFCDPIYEYKALIKLLASAFEFKSLVASAIFDKNEMIAFSINDLPNNEYASLLFWKANTKYEGIYQIMMKETINLYFSRRIKFFNFESDLGIESIKVSKLRYNPAIFLKKYKVEINN